MLTSLALIFLCGLLLGSIFKKLKLPGLIGMLIIGIVLGPYALNMLDESILFISPDLRQLALIIILTRAGLSLDIEDLMKIGRPAVLMSFIPACFEMAATILIAPLLFGIPLIDAVVMAAVVASASPAVIVPRMLHLMETGYGTNKNIPQMVLAGDSIDDAFNIVVFSSLLALSKGEGISAMRFSQIPISVLSGVLFGVCIGFLLTWLFRKIHMRDSVKVLLLLSVAFLSVALEESMEGIFPYSGLLSVMTAGVVLLKNAPAVAERISVKYAKLWVAAEIILFVLVGASLNPADALAVSWKAITLLVSVLAIRGAGILLCLIKTDLNWKERLFCVFTGIPKATVQAALGAIPLSMGLPSGELILAVAVFSILFTAPVGAFILDKTYKRLLTKE